ncbi:MAG: ImmA/IrrE family metallo-endopeptidase [Dehalococcoidia bacterium]
MTQPELPLRNMPAHRPAKEAALERARQILRESGIDGPPVDIERVARLMGTVAVEEARLGDVAACLLPGTRGHTILINRRSHPLRQRFSIAHEIGHLILGARGIRFRDMRTGPAERLCDELAAELLMPHEIFTREMDAKPVSLDTICDLANTFQTALEPAAIRFGALVSAPVQVVYWEKVEDHLRIKWTNGKPMLPRTATMGLLTDRAFGPAEAFNSDSEEGVTTYAHSSRSKSLDLICESKGFRERPYRYVLSLVRREVVHG